MVWPVEGAGKSQFAIGYCERAAARGHTARMDVESICLDRAQGTSLYDQVVNAFEAAIASGEFTPGDRLPSERELARTLGVSRTTTVNAYRELEARGIVRRHVGRGTVVCANQERGDAPFAWRGKVALGAERTSDVDLRSLVADTTPGTISFAPGIPAPDCFPMDTFRRLMDSVLSRGVEGSLVNGPTEGQPALRRALAARYGVAAQRVLVLAGSQQGLDLIARCLLDPGDVVVLDRPTYLGAIQIFKAAGARLVGWDAAEGDLDDLEDVILRYRPKFLYTNATFQNPTGRTIPLGERRDLLQLAARYRLPVVEDEPYGDLYFERTPPPPLIALDDHDLVLHLGTFSKTLALGLRIGWLVASETIVDQLALIKGRSDLFTPGPTQLVLGEMLTSRFFDTHLRTVRREHARRHNAMVDALKRHMPAGAVSWRPAEGGLFLWCRTRRVDARVLLQHALAAGVSFVPGDSFYPDNAGRHELRLCFTAVPVDGIDEGVHRLAGAYRTAVSISPQGGDGRRPLV
jgi:DNA-binding transcriptional MocR family regulator